MTLTLLDLYNTAASQEWVMYDNDAVSGSEMESSLVLAINKAITEIYFSYDFPFRERTHVVITVPYIAEYDLPNGIIKTDVSGTPIIKYNSALLDFVKEPADIQPRNGVPDQFYIKNDKIVLYPVPCEKNMMTIDYYTLVVGESASGEEIYSLKNATDTLMIPEYLEELAKEAIITRTMLNSIASESDENYSAYQKQAANAYKLLIKYSKGVAQNKKVLL